MNTDNKGSMQEPHDIFLLSSPQIYTVIMNNLPIGFSLLDKDGVIVEFNPAAERLTGYERNDVMNKSHFEIIHGSKDPRSCPLSAKVFEQHIPSIATETLLKKKDGETMTMLVVAFPLFDTSGNFIGGAELFRDISETKRLERERKNLLSMFAHDMKNPVIAAEGFLKRLFAEKAGPLNEKQKEYLGVITQAITSLQRLISDFLDFSRLEGKEYKPVPSPYNLEEAIYRQVEMTKIPAEKKGITVSCEFTAEDLPVIHADGRMIDRVLANLIENAIKYNNAGGTVIIGLRDADDNILVEVTDTGIGIDEKNLTCLFEAFCRVDRTTEGTGLGLSIAKAIIDAHHGTMQMESEPGKGSRFWFTLPKKTPGGNR